MNYPKAIFLMSGEVITITEAECQLIMKSLAEKPQGFIAVQGEMINKSSIVKVGNHHATAYVNKLEQNQEKTNMKITGGESKTFNEPDYYIDKHTGEKMYS